ncbi:MAG: PAS domain-containing protein, partial [Ignavibacteriaceae bacterium]|nr:PAS domain-containing protein [Ignavibacteriaceae bacterium]
MDNKVIAHDGIVVLNKENKIIVFNEAASRITGFQNRDVISKQGDFLFSSSDVKNLLLNQCLTSGEVFSNISLSINCSNNKKINVTASISPLSQPSHGIIGIILVFRDAQ